MSVLTKMIGFVATNDAARARGFYEGVLGFRLLGDDDFALVFDANGTMLRVAKAQGHVPGRGTVLGWEVDDVHAAIRALSGVKFEQFELPFLKQDELGVWTAPNGDQVAWFKDPDGNTLSISSHSSHSFGR